MALSGYVHGTTTFLARTNLEEGRAVQLFSGSLTDPSEVEYATGTDIIGITGTKAAAGQLVSVIPLNTDGTFEIDAVIESAISVGTDLYISDDGTGRVTDKDTTFFIGQSLSDNVVSSQRISVGAIAGGAIPVTDAESVLIADVGDYYTSTNVEGALQEIGAVLSHRPISESFPVTSAIMLNSNTSPRDKANIGGVLASDSQFAVLVNDNPVIPGMLMARLNIGTGGDTTAYFAVSMTPFYPMDNTQPVSIDLRYYLTGGTYICTGFLNVINSANDSFNYTFGPVTLPTTGGVFASEELFNTAFFSGFPIQQLFLDLRFMNTVDPASLNLDVLGFRLNYLTPALS